MSTTSPERVVSVPSSSQAGTTYQVTLAEAGDRCTCPAGEHGRACRHVRTARQQLAAAAPIQYPDPADAEAGLDAWHRYQERESEPLRADAARRDAEATPAEHQAHAAEAIARLGDPPPPSAPSPAVEEAAALVRAQGGIVQRARPTAEAMLAAEVEALEADAGLVAARQRGAEPGELVPLLARAGVAYRNLARLAALEHYHRTLELENRR